MTIERDQIVPVAALAVIVFVLGSCLHGCGGPPRGVQSALDVTARAVVATDEVVAVRYRAAHEAALDASTTRDEYRARMATWNRAEAALRAARVALLAAQSAVDAWSEAPDRGRAALGCLADAATLLVDALGELAITVPDGVLSVLSLASSIVGGCHPAEVSP